LKIFSRGQLNPGTTAPPLQRRFSLENDLRLILLMNGNRPRFRIHYPDEMDAASEVLVHLHGLQDLHQGVLHEYEIFATRLQLIRV